MQRVLIKVIALWLIVSGFFLFSCGSPEIKKNHHIDRIPAKLDYAKRFTVWKRGDITEIVVNSGTTDGDSLTYLLLPQGTEPPDNLTWNQKFRVPVNKMVVTSTSHLPWLDLLGISESLVGFPNPSYISSPAIRARIEQGLVEDMGTATGINFESLISLQPELVVTYISGADRSEIDQLDQSGIPYVLILDFLEESPLGRAEWIKFMGLLTGKSELADSVFREIKQQYLHLLQLTDSLDNQPTVFSGLLYGDTWFAPGANSFAAKFITQAGGEYTWGDLKSTGSVELSLEAVLDRNADSDYWIGTGDYSSRDALSAADPRYAHFQAFNSGNVYNYHRRIGPTGGFEYFELAGARPDIVLADLIKILHPDLLPDYHLYFYQKLD